MEKDLQGKIALVTGAGSGIGQAVALLYAEHGATVVVNDMSEKRGNETMELLKNAEAIFLQADVSKHEEVEALVNKIVAQYGRLDIACNNAGIGGEISNIADTTIEEWHKVISVNLSSVFYCMKYQLTQMERQGYGAIVNMTSVLGTVGLAGSAPYTASKHGVVGLTKNAALEYSTKGIRINAVAPGFTDTPLLRNMDEAARKHVAGWHATNRFGTAREVAELVVWLSSDKASFATGGYYPVDGGYLAK